MGYRLVLVVLLAASLGACGKEIGDSCVLSSDCSPNGDRLCDPVSQDGYCTVLGCDYSTCPDEAACIRFFTGGFSNKPCDPNKLSDPACSLDELCSLQGQDAGMGQCVPRSSEVRYCMRKCDSDDDCRDSYECRDLAKMKTHGGEPVLAPGVPVDEQHAPKFCAAKPL